MASCTLMFAVAYYLMAFGGLISCCAPVRPGANFWQPEKFFYGLLPIGVSVVMFVLAVRAWARAFARRRNAWLVGCVVAILAVILDLTLFSKYRGRQDEGIKLVWNSETGAFSWAKGEVKLPPGFSYKADHGIDTFLGNFASQDGNVVITHDIGELAGEHLGMGGLETLTEGSRVRVVLAIRSDGNGHSTFFSKVSFPDSGCANFYLRSSNEKDAAAIEFIASTFRPTGWTPSWVRPLLPEVFRSDCRYRLQLPGGL